MGDKQCGYCGSTDVSLTWQQFANGSTHIRLKCRGCQRGLGYAEQTPENIALASYEDDPPDKPTTKRMF